MTRLVVWSGKASDDYHKQLEFIADQNPINGELVDQRLMLAVDKLAALPSGHPGRVSGTYEKLVAKTSLIICYLLNANEIKIVRIIHAKRDWQKNSWPEDDA